MSCSYSTALDKSEGTDVCCLEPSEQFIPARTRHYEVSVSCHRTAACLVGKQHIPIL